MSGVTSLNTGAGALTGDIALSSSQPGLLGISSSPSAPYTVTFAPINAQVNQLNGKLGNVVLESPDNTLLFSPAALGATINVSGYVPSGSGGAGSALLQAQNLAGALAWAGGGGPPAVSTVAYAPGAVVIYSGTTFVCLVAQPVGSALPVDGTDWQSIGGGGGGGGGSSITNASSVLSIDLFGTLSYETADVAGNANQIYLATTTPSTTTETGPASITLDCAVQNSLINLNNDGTIIISTDNTTAGLTNNITISTTNPSSGSGGVIKLDADSVLDLVVGSGTATLQTLSGSGNPSLLITPGQGDTSYAGGGALYNCGTWSASAGYGKASVVQQSGTSYVCIDNVAPSVGGSNPTPSTTPANWLPLGGGGGGSSITNGGSILDIDNLGALTFATADVASNTNTILFETVVPTTSPGSGAGNMSFNSGASIQLTSGGAAGNIGLSNPAGTIEIALGPSSYISVGVIPVDYGSGTVPFYDVDAVWDAQSGYARGNIVALGSLATPSGWYLCIKPIPPVTAPAANPSPALGGDWLGVSGGGGSGATLTGDATGSVATNSTGNINVSVSATPQTGVLTTATTMVLPPAGASGGGNLLYRGLWSAGTAYAINDVALFGGNNWVCIEGTLAGESPITAPTYWREFATVSTGQNGALPTSMVQGTIPQNTPSGSDGISVWAAGTNYMKGNTVVSPTSCGVFQSAINGNTSNVPATDTGSNWTNLGVAPQLQNNLLTYGSNVAGNFSDSVAFYNNGVVDALDFGDVLQSLTPALSSYGGCHFSFNGVSSITWSAASNAPSIIGVQLFDNLTTNTHSYSTPVYFDTPLSFGSGGGSNVTPPFSVDIITPVVGVGGQQGYNLAYLTGSEGTIATASNFVTGAGSYVFSAARSNIAF